MSAVEFGAGVSSDASPIREKTAGVNLEQTKSNELALGEVAVDPKFAKRTLRKIDFRILPLLALIYTLAYIDRANISVARISGLDEDIGLEVGNRSSVALLVFFIGYIIFEMPSNILFKRVGAANWIAGITISFGAFTIGQGFVHDWISLTVLRACLGACEAGVYPAMVYLITCWYCRYEVQKRLAVFYLAAQLLASFGTILAYGLIQVSRYTPEYNGWRWIYIIEGAVTILVGFGSWFVMVDFPNSPCTKFLDAKQRDFVLKRLEDDAGVTTKGPVTWAIIWETCLDWQIWSYSFMYMTGAIGGYSFTLFLPVILQNSLGYSQELSFILSTPPVVFAVLVGGVVAWLADKIQLRGPFVAVLGTAAVVGFCMMGFLESATARLIGVFIGQAGVQGFVVTSLAWQANNIRGDAKRSVATAIIVMMSGVGGTYASLVFRQQDAPNYIPGIVAVLVPSILTVLVAVLTMFILRRRNREADEGRRIIEGFEGFRYTL